jgi:uncharacterized membrane protein
MLYVLWVLRTLLMLCGTVALVNYLLTAGAWTTIGLVAGAFFTFGLAAVDFVQTIESSN